MDRKYSMRICKCGHIHMVPEAKIDAAIKNDKVLMLVCRTCGDIQYIGADKTYDWFEEGNKPVYNMFSCEAKHDNFSIGQECFITDGESGGRGINEILFSTGLKVPMLSGEFASQFFYDRFYDNWYPEFNELTKPGITEKEIQEFIDKFHKNRSTVNMERFIKDTPDEYLREISGYIVRAFDWKGTKYEREWNT